jgi:hypothetical protein
MQAGYFLQASPKCTYGYTVNARHKRAFCGGSPPNLTLLGQGTPATPSNSPAKFFDVSSRRSSSKRE